MAENFSLISSGPFLSFYILPLIPTISKLPRWIKFTNSIFPNTNCTALVVWNDPNTIGSTLGYPKFTKYIRDITYIPSYHLSVLVGLLLSDAGLSKQTKSKNARLGFKQSMVHFPFFVSTFNILSPFCSSVPYCDNALVKNKQYFGIRMDSRAYPCFTILYNMFYKDKIKIVPADIYNLLTPVALAYWIMGDGKGNLFKGLYLCTDSFSDYDIVKLMNVLLIRYDIQSNLVKDSGKSRIYIPSTENKKVRLLVLDHVHPSIFCIIKYWVITL